MKMLILPFIITKIVQMCQRDLVLGETSLTQEAGFVDFLVAAWKKMKLMQFSPQLVSNHLRLVLQEMYQIA